MTARLTANIVERAVLFSENIMMRESMYKKKENPLRLLPADPEKRGKIKIRLEDILKERDISLNQLSFRAEMQRTQLRNYRDNKVQRLDIDILLRLCYVLECDLTDLIEYIPPED